MASISYIGFSGPRLDMKNSPAGTRPVWIERLISGFLISDEALCTVMSILPPVFFFTSSANWRTFLVWNSESAYAVAMSHLVCAPAAIGRTSAAASKARCITVLLRVIGSSRLAGDDSCPREAPERVGRIGRAFALGERLDADLVEARLAIGGGEIHADQRLEERLVVPLGVTVHDELPERIFGAEIEVDRDASRCEQAAGLG